MGTTVNFTVAASRDPQVIHVSAIVARLTGSIGSWQTLHCDIYTSGPVPAGPPAYHGDGERVKTAGNNC